MKNKDTKNTKEAPEVSFPLPNLRVLHAFAVHQKIPFLSQNLIERLYSL